MRVTADSEAAYRRAMALILARAMTSTDEFVFRPLDPAQMMRTGIEVDGEVEALAGILAGVDGVEIEVG